jgi:branched-chain amino acid transport system ATP-binding protein
MELLAVDEDPRYRLTIAQCQEAVWAHYEPANWLLVENVAPRELPEGRMVFSNLTVAENLAMGAYLDRDRDRVARNREEVFALFPRLRERLRQTAGTLSGGEQQMLAIGRALMGNPRFLMLDEPSLGIAPRLITTIFEQIVAINRQRGITILLVEQNANLALEVSSRAYVLETGRIVMSGPSPELRADPRLKATYLGG